MGRSGAVGRLIDGYMGTGRCVGPASAPREGWPGASLLVGAAMLAILLPGVLFLPSCTPDPVGPSLTALEAVPLEEIRMRVTGGFAGVDYTVVLDGSTGSLRGEKCRAGCGFQDGDVLRTLLPGQVTYLSVLFLEAGVPGMRGLDFGDQCCDQFHVEVDCRWEGEEGSFQGDSETLPAKVKEAVAALHGAVDGTLPFLVDFGTQPHLWPQDPFTVQEAFVVGDLLRVKVSYGGGCKTHELQVVAWGGWMESHPVQVRAFLTHEAFDDPCDAIITEDRYFDLGPLKRAYRKSYGTGDPGTTTLVIRLENHSGDAPQAAGSLEYRF
jgi:hypothetical protein